MTRAEAKELTIGVLVRIAKHMPVKGFLAECGGRTELFPTMDEARNWIHCQPDYLKEPNEMPSISFGYYKHVIVPIP